MRTQLSFELRCSVCRSTLECDMDKSKFEASSAMESKGVFRIEPCACCIRRAKEPAMLIKQAISKLGVME